jgi:hypothetical protein
MLPLRAIRPLVHRVPIATCGNAKKCRLSGVNRHFFAFPQVAIGTRCTTADPGRRIVADAGDFAQGAVRSVITKHATSTILKGASQGCKGL